MKKMLKRLSLFAVAVMILTGSLLVGTMAKYTSTYTGINGSVDIAKWSFSLGEDDLETSENLTVELVTDKYEGVEENYAAPGTSGSFEVVINNTGMVDADISLKFMAGTGNPDDPAPNIRFAYANTGTLVDEEGNANEGKFDLTGIELSDTEEDTDGNTWYIYKFANDEDGLHDDATTPITKADTATDADKVTITVYWYWDFEGDDDADTTLGIAGGAKQIVSISITATQSKPEKAGA